MLSKIYNFIKSNPGDVILAIAVILVTITSYNIGKIMALRSIKQPISIYQPAEGMQNIVRPNSAEQGSATILNTVTKTRDTQNEPVVASKNSKSKLYHFTWCPGASQIVDKNKISFTNETAAIAAGYTLAGNCKK